MSDISDIINLLEKQGTDFQSWKAKLEDKYTELSQNLDELAMKANRPTQVRHFLNVSG